MPHYKDSNNQIYWYDSEDEHSNFAPEGLVKITDSEADEIRKAAILPPSADELRAQRDSLIAAVAWRYDRHARELRLSLKPTDDLTALDTYMQSLADLTKQAGFPESITWPVAP